MADKKCAPSKTYKDGSCLTLEALQLIAKKHNNNTNTKYHINISDNKLEMVNLLEKALSNKCDDQICWTRVSVLEEIEKETFRPEGPDKRYAWLSTSDINDVVLQYQDKHPDFVFLGAVPADFEEISILGISDLDFNDFEKEGKTKLGIVINLDDSRGNGTHWVSLFINLKEGLIYYFDSVGKKPYERTKKFINKIVKYLYNKIYKKDININRLLKITKVVSKMLNVNKNNIQVSENNILELLNNMKIFDIRYNSIQHQFGNSECGVYSINFIVRLVGGESFDDITRNITKDNKINKCRPEYFRNVNF